MLVAHGIEAIVTSENQAALFGHLSGLFLSLDIWVASDDADDAAALLQDAREAGCAAGNDNSDANSGVADLDDADDDPASSLAPRIDRRQRTGVAVLLGCCLTFGAAHVLTGAWARGVGLAALELFGIVRLAGGHAGGGAAIAAAILADVLGAVWPLRAQDRSALAAARVHSS